MNKGKKSHSGLIALSAECVSAKINQLLEDYVQESLAELGDVFVSCGKSGKYEFCT